MDSVWTHEQRSRKKREIDKAARKTAQRIGAASIVVVAFFPGPDTTSFHILEGGHAPMSPKDLYAKLLSAHEIVEQSGGEDVALQ